MLSKRYQAQKSEYSLYDSIYMKFNNKAKLISGINV